MDNFSIP